MATVLPRKGMRVDSETTEKARRAVAAFRKLQPMLTSYARILTGDPKVRVDMAAKDNGSTDGKRIYFRPPMALGDTTPHERPLCDKRDSAGLMMCPACRMREEILVTIYHEIAHICFDSFAEITEEDKLKAVSYAINEVGGAYAERIKEAILRSRPTSYIGLAQYINEFFPFLVNCLEDARVNAALFKTRPGVIRMFYADTAKIFEDGFEAIDEEGKPVTRRWDEAPLNHQVMIGCFVKASGYRYHDWFHRDVVEALDDHEITMLLYQVGDAKTAGVVYNLAFKVLARLRALGFLATENDPDPEPEPESEEQDESSGDEPDASEEGESGSDSVPSGDGTDDVPESDEDRGGEGSRGTGTDEQPESSDSDSADEGEPDADNSGDDLEDSDRGGDSSEDADDEQAGSGDADGEPSDASEDDVDKEGEPVSGGDGDASDDSASDGSDSDDGDVGESSGEGAGGEPAADGAETEPDEGPVTSDYETTGDIHAGDSPASGDDSDPVDTGADDGYGGTEVQGDDDESRPEMGTPDDMGEILAKWGDHEEKPKSIEAEQEEAAVDVAIIQGIYFTKPSNHVWGVREHHFDKHWLDDNGVDYSIAWTSKSKLRRSGASADMEVPEQFLQPALGAMRRTFSDNARGGVMPNLKTGKINSRVLGKRAPLGDPRLFHKHTQPGKKSYHVVIGMDISGSTIGVNLALEKRAIMAQADLLDRVGIGFSIYAHTGNYGDAVNGSGLALDVYHIKGPDERWNDETKVRLEKIGPAAANLDGHAMEFLRKRLDERTETDKILLYYSDGKMPAENHDEELSILTSEIRTCRNQGYTLLGVGIRTDSPARHGLDTVQVDDDSDLVKVVQQLGKRLAGK